MTCLQVCYRESKSQTLQTPIYLPPLLQRSYTTTSKGQNTERLAHPQCPVNHHTKNGVLYQNKRLSHYCSCSQIRNICMFMDIQSCIMCNYKVRLRDQNYLVGGEQEILKSEPVRFSTLYLFPIFSQYIRVPTVCQNESKKLSTQNKKPQLFRNQTLNHYNSYHNYGHRRHHHF